MKNEQKWYALKVFSGKEKKIKPYLELEIDKKGLKEYFTQILIPSEKVYEIRAGKKRTIERNFLPGYVLIQADLSHSELKNIVTTMPGVSSVLNNDSKVPIPLRQIEVNRILGKVDADEDDFEEKLETPFSVGEAVKIIDGPFNGFKSNIQNICEERKKLNVIVTIFGRDTPIELSYMQVEKLT